MGNFYTNFEIVGGNSTEVLQVAKELGRKAFVISDKNSDTLLFDADCDEQDVTEIERLGGQLADKLHLPVVASLNHDDDQLLLWLFRSGQVKRYESCLQAFRFGWELSKVRGGVFSYPFIAAMLTWPIFIFEVFRHLLLVKVTGLSPICVGLGYKYLSRGTRPPGFTEDDIKCT
jgi:hypothetical protein